MRAGTKVILCDLPESDGSNVAERLGDDCIFVPTDITSEQDVNTALETAKLKFGRLDVCVNCAGVSCTYEVYNFNKNLPHDLGDFARMMTVSFGIIVWNSFGKIVYL